MVQRNLPPRGTLPRMSSYDEDEDEEGLPATGGAPVKWRFQFRLGTLLITIVPIAVLAAIFRNVLRDGADPAKNPRVMLFLALALAAPMLLLVAASLVPPFKRWLEKRRQRKHND